MIHDILKFTGLMFNGYCVYSLATMIFLLIDYLRFRVTLRKSDSAITYAFLIDGVFMGLVALILLVAIVIEIFRWRWFYVLEFFLKLILSTIICFICYLTTLVYLQTDEDED